MRLGVAIVLFTWCCASMTVAQEAAADPLLEEIRAAWQARQDRYNSFIAEWETIANRMELGKQGHEEISETVTHRIECDGGKIHYVRRGKLWDIDLWNSSIRRSPRFLTGTSEKQLWQNPKMGDHPGGFVNDSGIVFKRTISASRAGPPHVSSAAQEDLRLRFRPMATNGSAWHGRRDALPGLGVPIGRRRGRVVVGG